MTDHIVTLKTIRPVTHDTYELVIERPEGYEFVPGQATHWSLERSGFENANRPFTITSLPDRDELEFVIKSYPTDQYPDHDGFTELIPGLRPGEPIHIDDAGGDIEDQGPGTFIAGGAGVTPFIPILKARQRRGDLEGCTLIFSNKTEQDVILRDVWERMEGVRTVFTVTDQDDSDLPQRQVDRAFIEEILGGPPERAYVCGPPPLMKSVIGDLRDMGLQDEAIVVEKDWLED